MTTLVSRDQLPPLPTAPYVIGIESGSPIHAVAQQAAQQVVWNGDNDRHRVHTHAACGADVVLARRWGAFARGEKHVDRQQVCAHCAWAVALHHGTGEAELALLTPTGAELDALTRALPDPLISFEVCRALLDDRAANEDRDPDAPGWARLLGCATEHRPVPLMSGDCADGECDHEDPDDCYGPTPQVACRACSLDYGPEMGELEGQAWITVPAPCSVLTALSGRYL